MFSSNIRELMKKKSMTMERLSAETGLSTRTIDRARGKLISECKLSTLAKIGAALGVKTKRLYDEVDGTESEQTDAASRTQAKE